MQICKSLLRLKGKKPYQKRKEESRTCWICTLRSFHSMLMLHLGLCEVGHLLQGKLHYLLLLLLGKLSSVQETYGTWRNWSTSLQLELTLLKTTSCSSNCQIKSFFTLPSLFWHLDMQLHLCAPKDGGFALLASSSSLRFMYILWTQHVNMFTYICMYIYLYVKPQRLRRASWFLRNSYYFTQHLTPALSTSDSRVVSFFIDLSFQARKDYSVITEGKK